MIIQAYCSSFKQQLLEGVHDFRATGGNTFKIALYTEFANLNSTTTEYSTTGEVVGDGYTAGGLTLASISPTIYNSSGICSFADAVWSGVSFSARGALIYNTTPNSLVYVNPSCVVLDFGILRTPVGNTFTLKFPQATDMSAIIRIN